MASKIDKGEGIREQSYVSFILPQALLICFNCYSVLLDQI